MVRNWISENKAPMGRVRIPARNKIFPIFMKFFAYAYFDSRSLSCYYFSIYSRFDMYGAGSKPSGDHKLLPFHKNSPNQLIFCILGFFDMWESNLKEFFNFAEKLTL
jgi:hypothetical protein